ncbi:MAG: hypothetical protein AAF491_05045, partial [Verrucomicrobiota bacterium]
MIPISRDAAILSLAVLGLVGLIRGWLPPMWRHALILLVAVRLVMPALPAGPLSWQRFLPDPALERSSVSETETPKTVPAPAPKEIDPPNLEQEDLVSNPFGKEPALISGDNAIDSLMGWLPAIWIGGCLLLLGIYLYS